MPVTPDPNNPAMTRIVPGPIYRHRSGRLFSTDNNLSLIVPKGSTGQEGGSDIFVIKQASSLLEATLYLHNGSDWLVKSWMDEEIKEGGETLRPTEPARDIRGIMVRRFASPGYVGYRVKMDDPFRSGFSGIFHAPIDREAELKRLLSEVVHSTRFVRVVPFAQKQADEAVVQFTVTPAETHRDLFLYIDRHFYTLRDEVLEVLRLLVLQAEKERHPGLVQFKERLDIANKSRELVRTGGWDKFVADLRSTQGQEGGGDLIL